MLKRNSCGFSGRSSLRNSSEHPANGSTKDPLAAKQRGHSSTSPGLRGSRVNGSPHSRQVTVFLAGMEQALFLVRLQPSRINAPEHRSWHSDVKPSADAFETRANVMKAIQGHILAKASTGACSDGRSSAQVNAGLPVRESRRSGSSQTQSTNRAALGGDTEKLHL